MNKVPETLFPHLEMCSNCAPPKLQFSGSEVKVAQLCPTLCNPMDCTVHGILLARILAWVALPFSRGSSQPRDQNPGLPHCRRILYQLSHQGSPRILEWVAYPFSSRSFWPRNQTEVSWTAGGFFTNWAMGLLEFRLFSSFLLFKKYVFLLWYLQHMKHFHKIWIYFILKNFTEYSFSVRKTF